MSTHLWKQWKVKDIFLNDLYQSKGPGVTHVAKWHKMVVDC